MAFEDAVQQVLKDEGGFFHNQKTGEVVNFGITLKFMQAAVNAKATEVTIRALTKDAAIQIYKKYFWEIPHFDKIKDPKVASLLFYLGVNMGVPESIKLAQTACNTLGKKIAVDAADGPTTLAAINSVDAVKLHAEICTLAENRYKHIAANPVEASNLPGWLARLKRYADDPPITV